MDSIVVVVSRIDQLLTNIKNEMRKHGIEPMGHHLTDVPKEFPGFTSTARGQVDGLEHQVRVLRDLIIGSRI